MDTFLIRTLLIPALVVLLGRWNWWPAPLYRRASTIPAPEAPPDQTGPVLRKERR